MRVVAGLVSAGACAVLVLTAGCGAGSAPREEPAATVTVEKTPDTPEPSAATQEPPPAADPRPAGQWVMPNLVGATLQDAQDQVQALTSGGVYVTGSHDLGGQSRSQVLDRNWRVCTQNIAAGAALTAASEVDFGVVKLEESCP
jgi:hypothetical protein